MIEYIDGDLIKLAKEGTFDVIAHGCNCFCTMNSGIAPQMKEAFSVDKMPLEQPEYKGDYGKLGRIDWYLIEVMATNVLVTVVNAYTQFGYGNFNPTGVAIPLDYEALTLCMRKINFYFGGKHIGLPKIGSGLAGGDWSRIEAIIDKELKDCIVTVVNYKP